MRFPTAQRLPLQPDTGNGGGAGGGGGYAFQWAPLMSTVYRGELPQRLCAPLGGRFRSPLSLLRLHSQLLPSAVAGLPDLQVRWFDIVLVLLLCSRTTGFNALCLGAYSGLTADVCPHRVLGISGLWFRVQVSGFRV